MFVSLKLLNGEILLNINHILFFSIAKTGKTDVHLIDGTRFTVDKSYDEISYIFAQKIINT